MRIGLIDVDGHNGYPNLALMKISQYHKNCGDEVEWAQICTHYDIIYASKIFSFTPDWNDAFFLADTIIRGGTGYGEPYKSLPEYIDRLQPDYSLYPEKIDHRTAYGFITRGCPNKCYWCVVPKKEGKVRTVVLNLTKKSQPSAVRRARPYHPKGLCALRIAFRYSCTAKRTLSGR